MAVYKFGRFEVHSLSELARTSIAMAALAPLALAARSHRSQHLSAALARRFLAMNETIEGLDHVDAATSYLVAPLHEGFADALLLGHLGLNLRFVARDELFEWPILGRVLSRTGQIQVTPEHKVRGFRRLIAATGEAIDRGESVVFFPQGSILGVEAAFNRGPFRIADKLGVQVLPVVITGTHRVWEHPYSDRLRFRQPVFMRVLEPLEMGRAEVGLDLLQRQMKEIALASAAPARRFDPDVDGYWDDYAYEIDPAFTSVALQVAEHRASLPVTSA